MIPKSGNRFSDKIMRKEMSMRRVQRIVLLATFVLVVPVLSGCANFDPESLDIFGLGDKKKLPGDRKPVFPEGVPGVTQGVPKEYIKGNQPAADTALLPPEQAAPAAAPADEETKAEPKAEPKPKPKPKRKVVAKPQPVAAAPVQPVSQAPQQQPQAQQAPAGWPQGSTPPASASGSTAAWPAPPASGTFSR